MMIPAKPKPDADLTPFERARIYGVPASEVPGFMVRAMALADSDPLLTHYRATRPADRLSVRVDLKITGRDFARRPRFPDATDPFDYL